MSEKFQILLPVYNEASSIRKTLFDIYEALKDEINFEFIITEDGILTVIMPTLHIQKALVQLLDIFLTFHDQ
mgnify:CR=1 FL=1